MNFKAVEEVNEVNYPSCKDSKNSLWKLALSNKNVGIGVLCIYLLINECFANSFNFDNFPEVGGDVVTVIITPKELAVNVAILVVSILMVGVIIALIVKKIKKYQCDRKDVKKE